MYYFIHACFFADIACKVVACCAGPECCFCLHLFVLTYNSWRLLFTCVNIKVFRTVSFVFHLPTRMLYHCFFFCFVFFFRVRSRWYALFCKTILLELGATGNRTPDYWHKVWLICVHSVEYTSHSKYALLTMSVDGPAPCKQGCGGTVTCRV